MLPVTTQNQLKPAKTRTTITPSHLKLPTRTSEYPLLPLPQTKKPALAAMSQDHPQSTKTITYFPKQTTVISSITQKLVIASQKLEILKTLQNQ